MNHLIQISDTHIGPSPDFELNGARPFELLQILLQSIAHFPCKIDALIHTGDVAADGSQEAYHLCAELFSELPFPCYFIAGNHDITNTLDSTLNPATRTIFCSDSGSYLFMAGRTTCIGIHARGDDAIDPHGVVADKTLNALSNTLNNLSSPCLVFIHFPPLSLDSHWINKKMLLINGKDLHDLFVRFREKIHSVHFGHIHRDITCVVDSIHYCSVTSTMCEFSCLPDDVEPSIRPVTDPSFNLISVSSESVVTKRYVADGW